MKAIGNNYMQTLHKIIIGNSRSMKEVADESTTVLSERSQLYKSKVEYNAAE